MEEEDFQEQRIKDVQLLEKKLMALQSLKCGDLIYIVHKGKYLPVTYIGYSLEALELYQYVSLGRIPMTSDSLHWADSITVRDKGEMEHFYVKDITEIAKIEEKDITEIAKMKKEKLYDEKKTK